MLVLLIWSSKINRKKQNKNLTKKSPPFLVSFMKKNVVVFCILFFFEKLRNRYDIPKFNPHLLSQPSTT